MEGSSTYEPAQCHNAAVSDSSSLSDEFEGEREPPLTPHSPSVFDLTSISDALHDNRQAAATSKLPSSTEVGADKIPAPTAILNPPYPQGLPDHPTFYSFPRLPKDLRECICEWLDPPPQILHLSYEQHPSTSRYNRVMKRMEWWGTWEMLSPQLCYENYLTVLPNRSICRESRRHCTGKYSTVHLGEDPTNLIIFSFKTDTLFLDYNILPERGFLGGILPPPGARSPFNHDHHVKHLAICKEFWFDWKFLKDMGDDWRDTSKENFKNWTVAHMHKLKTVRLAQGTYLLPRSSPIGCLFVDAGWRGFPPDPHIARFREAFQLNECVDIKTVWAERLDTPGWTHSAEDYTSGIWQ